MMTCIAELSGSLGQGDLAKVNTFLLRKYYTESAVRTKP